MSGIGTKRTCQDVCALSYARAYGLTRDELRYILDPADVKGPDYPSETFRVLKKNEIARFGEYRTARLVLAAYDQLTKHPLAANDCAGEPARLRPPHPGAPAALRQRLSPAPRP